MVVCDECGNEFATQDAPLLEGYPVCRECIEDGYTEVKPGLVLLGRGNVVARPAMWEQEV